MDDTSDPLYTPSVSISRCVIVKLPSFNYLTCRLFLVSPYIVYHIGQGYNNRGRVYYNNRGGSSRGTYSACGHGFINISLEAQTLGQSPSVRFAENMGIHLLGATVTLIMTINHQTRFITHWQQKSRLIKLSTMYKNDIMTLQQLLTSQIMDLNFNPQNRN